MSKTLNPKTALWAREIWDRALNSTNGIELEFKAKREAEHARFNLYTARTLDREINRTMLPVDDPLHGHSVWDDFRATIEHRDIDTTRKFFLVITSHAKARVEIKVRELE